MLCFAFALLFPIFKMTADNTTLLEGFDVNKKVKAAYSDKYICLTQKIVPSFWEYPLSSKDSISWESSNTPANSKGSKVVFSIACGLGVSKGENGWHEIYINGKKLAEFNTLLKNNMHWQGEGGEIDFHTLYIDGNNDFFGIMRITPNENLINYGQPQIFKAIGKNNKSNSWFMLSKLPSSLGFDIKKLQRQNNIKEKTLSIQKTAKEQTKKDASVKKRSGQRICRWQRGKKAAVSFSSSPEENAVNFFAKGKNLMDAANSALDKAVENGVWLNEIWSKKLKSSKAYSDHIAYLKKLDCVAWLSCPETIKQYTELKRQGKINVEKTGDNSMRVSLKGYPQKFSSDIKLTLQVLLPDETWEAKAFRNKIKTPLQYVVEENKKFIRFDFTPGSEPVDVHIKK
jgi:hypothetical protein